jgi:hypothetical protein
LEVTGVFEPRQQVIHRLLRHVRPSRQLCRADAVESWALKDVHVSGRQVSVTSRLKIGMKPLPDVEVQAPYEGGEQRDVH